MYVLEGASISRPDVIWCGIDGEILVSDDVTVMVIACKSRFQASILYLLTEAACGNGDITRHRVGCGSDRRRLYPKRQLTTSQYKASESFFSKIKAKGLHFHSNILPVQSA